MALAKHTTVDHFDGFDIPDHFDIFHHFDIFACFDHVDWYDYVDGSGRIGKRSNGSDASKHFGQPDHGCVVEWHPGG
ncbi:hypothetical protein EVC45_36160 [Paraburkholderia sp. UYCP14C]|uniref:hypothetical protein n=1 Tax=Paraburkholderia sp. UYCP14C TaxID=2511130 RepID=UPI001020ADB3|nr:hypothetical protein [Paraburkholderia sp. UYCP14C]RZF24914.1 hypothetical protein EVC45_36160 [Paraburkholderia sp. UYCP14C]